MKARVRCLISGRVQGVAYRWFAEREASSLGLAGWAQNLPDGNVEILAEGKKSDLDSFIARLRIGPSHARVDELKETWSDFGGDLRGFRILRGW